MTLGIPSRFRFENKPIRPSDRSRAFPLDRVLSAQLQGALALRSDFDAMKGVFEREVKGKTDGDVRKVLIRFNQTLENLAREANTPILTQLERPSEINSDSLRVIQRAMVAARTMVETACANTPSQLHLILETAKTHTVLGLALQAVLMENLLVQSPTAGSVADQIQQKSGDVLATVRSHVHADAVLTLMGAGMPEMVPTNAGDRVLHLIEARNSQLKAVGQWMLSAPNGADIFASLGDNVARECLVQQGESLCQEGTFLAFQKVSGDPQKEHLYHEALGSIVVQSLHDLKGEAKVAKARTLAESINAGLGTQAHPLVFLQLAQAIVSAEATESKGSAEKPRDRSRSQDRRKPTSEPLNSRVDQALTLLMNARVAPIHTEGYARLMGDFFGQLPSNQFDAVKTFLDKQSNTASPAALLPLWLGYHSALVSSGLTRTDQVVNRTRNAEDFPTLSRPSLEPRPTQKGEKSLEALGDTTYSPAARASIQSQLQVQLATFDGALRFLDLMAKLSKTDDVATRIELNRQIDAILKNHDVCVALSSNPEQPSSPEALKQEAGSNFAIMKDLLVSDFTRHQAIFEREAQNDRRGLKALSRQSFDLPQRRFLEQRLEWFSKISIFLREALLHLEGLAIQQPARTARRAAPSDLNKESWSTLREATVQVLRHITPQTFTSTLKMAMLGQSTLIRRTLAQIDPVALEQAVHTVQQTHPQRQQQTQALAQKIKTLLETESSITDSVATDLAKLVLRVQTQVQSASTDATPWSATPSFRHSLFKQILDPNLWQDLQAQTLSAPAKLVLLQAVHDQTETPDGFKALLKAFNNDATAMDAALKTLLADIATTRANLALFQGLQYRLTNGVHTGNTVLAGVQTRLTELTTALPTIDLKPRVQVRLAEAKSEFRMTALNRQVALAKQNLSRLEIECNGLAAGLGITGRLDDARILAFTQAQDRSGWEGDEVGKKAQLEVLKGKMATSQQLRDCLGEFEQLRASFARLEPGQSIALGLTRREVFEGLSQQAAVLTDRLSQVNERLGVGSASESTISDVDLGTIKRSILGAVNSITEATARIGRALIFIDTLPLAQIQKIVDARVKVSGLDKAFFELLTMDENLKLFLTQTPPIPLLEAASPRAKALLLKWAANPTDTEIKKNPEIVALTKAFPALFAPADVNGTLKAVLVFGSLPLSMLRQLQSHSFLPRYTFLKELLSAKWVGNPDTLFVEPPKPSGDSIQDLISKAKNLLTEATNARETLSPDQNQIPSGTERLLRRHLVALLAKDWNDTSDATAADTKKQTLFEVLFATTTVKTKDGQKAVPVFSATDLQQVYAHLDDLVTNIPKKGQLQAELLTKMGLPTITTPVTFVRAAMVAQAVRGIKADFDLTPLDSLPDLGTLKQAQLSAYCLQLTTLLDRAEMNADVKTKVQAALDAALTRLSETVRTAVAVPTLSVKDRDQQRGFLGVLLAHKKGCELLAAEDGAFWKAMVHHLSFGEALGLLENRVKAVLDEVVPVGSPAAARGYDTALSTLVPDLAPTTPKDLRDTVLALFDRGKTVDNAAMVDKAIDLLNTTTVSLTDGLNLNDLTRLYADFANTNLVSDAHRNAWASTPTATNSVRTQVLAKIRAAILAQIDKSQFDKLDPAAQRQALMIYARLAVAESTADNTALLSDLAKQIPMAVRGLSVEQRLHFVQGLREILTPKATESGIREALDVLNRLQASLERAQEGRLAASDLERTSTLGSTTPTVSTASSVAATTPSSPRSTDSGLERLLESIKALEPGRNRNDLVLRLAAQITQKIQSASSEAQELFEHVVAKLGPDLFLVDDFKPLADAFRGVSATTLDLSVYSMSTLLYAVRTQTLNAVQQGTVLATCKDEMWSKTEIDQKLVLLQEFRALEAAAKLNGNTKLSEALSKYCDEVTQTIKRAIQDGAFVSALRDKFQAEFQKVVGSSVAVDYKQRHRFLDNKLSELVISPTFILDLMEASPHSEPAIQMLLSDDYFDPQSQVDAQQPLGVLKFLESYVQLARGRSKPAILQLLWAKQAQILFSQSPMPTEKLVAVLKSLMRYHDKIQVVPFLVEQAKTLPDADRKVLFEAMMDTLNPPTETLPDHLNRLAPLLALLATKTDEKLHAGLILEGLTTMFTAPDAADFQKALLAVMDPGNINFVLSAAKPDQLIALLGRVDGDPVADKVKTAIREIVRLDNMTPPNVAIAVFQRIVEVFLAGKPDEATSKQLGAYVWRYVAKESDRLSNSSSLKPLLEQLSTNKHAIEVFFEALSAPAILATLTVATAADQQAWFDVVEGCFSSVSEETQLKLILLQVKVLSAPALTDADLLGSLLAHIDDTFFNELAAAAATPPSKFDVLKQTIMFLAGLDATVLAALPENDRKALVETLSSPILPLRDNTHGVPNEVKTVLANLVPTLPVPVLVGFLTAGASIEFSGLLAKSLLTKEATGAHAADIAPHFETLVDALADTGYPAVKSSLFTTDTPPKFTAFADAVLEKAQDATAQLARLAEFHASLGTPPDVALEPKIKERAKMVSLLSGAPALTAPFDTGLPDVAAITLDAWTLSKIPLITDLATQQALLVRVLGDADIDQAQKEAVFAAAFKLLRLSHDRSLDIAQYLRALVIGISDDAQKNLVLAQFDKMLQQQSPFGTLGAPSTSWRVPHQQIDARLVVLNLMENGSEKDDLSADLVAACLNTAAISKLSAEALAFLEARASTLDLSGVSVADQLKLFDKATLAETPNLCNLLAKSLLTAVAMVSNSSEIAPKFLELVEALEDNDANKALVAHLVFTADGNLSEVADKVLDSVHGDNDAEKRQAQLACLEQFRQVVDHYPDTDDDTADVMELVVDQRKMYLEWIEGTDPADVTDFCDGLILDSWLVARIKDVPVEFQPRLLAKYLTEMSGDGSGDARVDCQYLAQLPAFKAALPLFQVMGVTWNQDESELSIPKHLNVIFKSALESGVHNPLFTQNATMNQPQSLGFSRVLDCLQPLVVEDDQQNPFSTIDGVGLADDATFETLGIAGKQAVCIQLLQVLVHDPASTQASPGWTDLVKPYLTYTLSSQTGGTLEDRQSVATGLLTFLTEHSDHFHNEDYQAITDLILKLTSTLPPTELVAILGSNTIAPALKQGLLEKAIAADMQHSRPEAQRARYIALAEVIRDSALGRDVTQTLCTALLAKGKMIPGTADKITFYKAIGVRLNRFEDVRKAVVGVLRQISVLGSPPLLSRDLEDCFEAIITLDSNALNSDEVTRFRASVESTLGGFKAQSNLDRLRILRSALAIAVVTTPKPQPQSDDAIGKFIHEALTGKGVGLLAPTRRKEALIEAIEQVGSGDQGLACIEDIRYWLANISTQPDISELWSNQYSDAFDRLVPREAA
ncbi:MAG: hypothetical protein AB7F28_06085 [Candidatus Margulisiibacteriota bacterium]